MHVKIRNQWVALGAAAVLATTGCATSSTNAQDQTAAETAELRRSLDERNRELQQKQAEVAKLNDELRAKGETLPPVSARGAMSGDSLLPPGAKPASAMRAPTSRPSTTR
jgi:septal ring factor EnvC (AmiA/AmiB activator)